MIGYHFVNCLAHLLWRLWTTFLFLLGCGYHQGLQEVKCMAIGWKRMGFRAECWYSFFDREDTCIELWRSRNCYERCELGRNHSSIHHYHHNLHLLRHNLIVVILAGLAATRPWGYQNGFALVAYSPPLLEINFLNRFENGSTSTDYSLFNGWDCCHVNVWGDLIANDLGCWFGADCRWK